MKYLITGGAGFIGSTLVNRLSTEENEIYIVDDLSMGDLTNLNKDVDSKLHFFEGSVTDEVLMRNLFRDNQFDYIFHLAAVASVADSVARPVETHKVNFESVLLILELCRETQKKLKRVVFSSSAAVYGDEPTIPKTEESIIRPLTPYAVDKFAGERYVLNYNTLYGIPTSAVRFFNVYGPNQNPDSPYSGVLSILTSRFEKVMNGEDISFTIFGDGEQTRDFVYVDDVVDALLIVSSSNESLGNVYNVGTGKATSLNEIVSLYKKILKADISVNYSSQREGDIQKSVASIDKLREIGYKPQYNIQAGVAKYLTSVVKLSSDL